MAVVGDGKPTVTHLENQRWRRYLGQRPTGSRAHPQKSVYLSNLGFHCSESAIYGAARKMQYFLKPWMTIKHVITTDFSVGPLRAYGILFAKLAGLLVQARLRIERNSYLNIYSQYKTKRHGEWRQRNLVLNMLNHCINGGIGFRFAKRGDKGWDL